MNKVLKRKTLKSAWLVSVLLALLVFSVFFTQLAYAREGESNRERRRERGDNPKLRLGEFPPDFELPILTLDTDSSGKYIGRINDNNTIKLSSFFGKKPVCIFMSSYT
ncbi:MAG: hypothetical protein ACYTFM_03450 [Planctomycetota bacterium]|jgi:hypothetical protein